MFLSRRIHFGGLLLTCPRAAALAFDVNALAFDQIRPHPHPHPPNTLPGSFWALSHNSSPVPHLKFTSAFVSFLPVVSTGLALLTKSNYLQSSVWHI